MRLSLLAALLSACVEPSACPPADLSPIAGEPAYAFVASDYASSAIGLLDADGRVLRESWIATGTTPPQIVTTLSGDTVLASSPLAPCVVTAIDRHHDVLTFLDACAEPAVIGQLDVGPSFYANPQDAVAIDDTRALVSRANPNIEPGAPELERGNDLLVIDWRAARILSRIDLSALDHVGEERIYARPQRMALLERDDARVVIAGLARLSGDWMVAGPGAVALVDLATLERRALPIDGLVNCGEVDAVPGAPAMAVITCNGATFGTTEDRRAGAGVALLELRGDGEVEVRARWRAAEHPDGPVFNTWSVPLSAERVVTIAMGDYGGVPDRAAALTFATGPAQLPMRAADAYVLGDGAYDPSRELLLVPDAHDGTIRRLAMGDAPSELEPIAASACRGLPPREVRRITP